MVGVRGAEASDQRSVAVSGIQPSLPVRFSFYGYPAVRI
jgi:hypothetical protein